MSLIETKPVSRKTDLVIQEFDEEILIYDLTANKAFSLNKSSATIWQACDGSKTIGEISAQASKKLNSAVSKDFVLLALSQLQADNLIEHNSEISSSFQNLSRREIIRKVGFASMVALPLISSLVAPTAINAQSCGGSANRANGCTCSTQSQCSSGCCSSAPRTCVSGGSKGQGTSCIANCECSTGLTCKGSPQTCQP